jgi:putative tryptophan/tyrosine transport system substrate-binding protein
MTIDIGRRQFIAVLSGAAAAWPLAARAQQGAVRRIGILASLSADDPEMQARLAGFREGIEKLGWFEGRNVRIDTRFASPITLAPDLAKELVAQQPDVILAQATPMAAILKQESHTIPIVFVAVSDPIGAGFVGSLARPDGNLTGLMLFDSSVAGKWLAMLKEVSPSLKRVVVLANPKISYAYWLKAAQAAAPSLGIEIVPGPVESAADIESASVIGDAKRVSMRTLRIVSFARVPDGGLLLPPDFSTLVHRELIVALAARHRLPAVFSDRDFVAAGGLMSYGVKLVEQFRQAAYYIDQILRGAKPADLPVQAPTKYQTVFNLKTAKAIGLDVQPSMLVRADEVIE